MKLTKSQAKALESLLLDLDELENKPRRLFHALEEFAFAFNKTSCVPSIREAQDTFYSSWDRGEFLKDISVTMRNYKIKVWERQVSGSFEMDDASLMISGAKEFSDELSKHLLTTDL